MIWIIWICWQSLDLQGYKISQTWHLQNINTQCKHTDTKKQNRILRLYSEGETREHKAQGGECSAEGRVGGTESSSRSSSKSKPCKVRGGSRLGYTIKEGELFISKKTLSAEKSWYILQFIPGMRKRTMRPAPHSCWGHRRVLHRLYQKTSEFKGGLWNCTFGDKLYFSKRNFLQKIHKTMFANTQFTKVRV